MRGPVRRVEGTAHISRGPRMAMRTPYNGPVQPKLGMVATRYLVWWLSIH